VGSLFKVLRGVARADLTLTWFASVYSFFVVYCAKLMGKPSIVILAGVDVVSLPAIGYGLRLSRWKRLLVKWALRGSTRVLAVHPFLIREAVQLTNTDGKNMLWLPTGCDPALWTPAGKKEPLVLTVAGCRERDSDEGQRA